MGASRRLVALLGACALLCPPPARAATGADEYAIRAAMLLNIARFVEWPAWKLGSPNAEFEVCLLGQDPIGPLADKQLQHQSVAGHAVVVRHLLESDDASSCHVLYVAADQGRRLTRLGAMLAKSAVLTISEQPNSSLPQQVVGLPTVDEHVRIDINLPAAQRNGLSISSRLLALATVAH